MILTKGIGTGIISTAAKAGVADPAILQNAVDSMTALNAPAAQAIAGMSVHALTDITGFGLLGHASEMARGAGLSFRLSYSRIPILRGAREYAAIGMVPGGGYCNRDHFGKAISFTAEVPEVEQIILFDPQTSGGLLVALPPEDAQKMIKKLSGKAVIVGKVIRQKDRNIIVR